MSIIAASGRRALLVLALAAGLTSCARYKPASLVVAAPLAPDLTDLPPRPLTVTEIAALAVARDPELMAARTRGGVAAAQLVQAGVLPNPALAGAFLPLVSGFGVIPAWNIGLAQDVKSLLIYRPRRRAARDAVAQVRADLLWREWQVAGQARQLATDLIERERGRPLLTEVFGLLQRRQQVTQAALAAGNATLVTTAPSAVAFQATRAALQVLDQAQLDTRHRLNALLRLSPDVVVPLVTSADVAPINVASARAAISSLPQRRPDLLALRFGYAAQDQALRAAILAQFPDLILGASATSDSSRVINAGPSAQIGLPLFDRNQGNIAIAGTTRAQLGAEYAARLATTTGEAGALVAQIEQLRAQRVIVERDLPAARLAAQRASAAFGRSALDERAYVDLVTNRFAKEQEVLALRLALLDRQIALETLLGVGLPTVDTLGLPDPGLGGDAG